MRAFSLTSGLSRSLAGAAALLAATIGANAATPSLIADLVTGEVIAQEEATRPWYPASLTKLMTAYVALKAVREGRVTMDTPFVVSARATRAAPSKMGFNPGTEVTLDNALKMLMVKSANDIAIMIAEGVSGSVEDFAVEMNNAAAALGMRQSHFVNPNGLHDPAHVSSARDMAILARALYLEFPKSADLYGIGALKLGDRVIPTHNGLLGRYPGADGMKTGFVCASGFNVVASAMRNGRHLVVVVMGSPNAKARTIRAAGLFDMGFGASGFMRKAALASLPEMAGPPPNMREEICGRNKKKVVQEDDLAVVPQSAPTGDEGPAAFFATDGRAGARQFVMGPRPIFEPVEIFVGRKPDWNGPVAMARATPSAPAAAAAVAGASAFAAQQGIGATASRAIAVKSLPDKKAPVNKASVRLTPDIAKMKADAVKAKAVKKEEKVKKAQASKKADPKKAEPKKAEAKKPEPAKTASKAKDRTQ